jgi:hypothetical protein
VIFSKCRRIALIAAAARDGEDSRGAQVDGEAAVQLSLLGASDAFLEELASLDVDGLTPLQAITIPYELREKARGKQG